MKSTKNTRERLLDHLHRYPKMELQDIFKFLHQSTLGCEHLVSTPETAIRGILDETAKLPPNRSLRIEPLDGPFSRVHLPSLGDGIRPETLGKLFYLSAQAPYGTAEELQKKISEAKLLSEQGLISDREEFNYQYALWEADGFPALHHSESFRQAYAPAYRVISNTYLPFLPLLERLDRMLARGSVTLAIEGGSASGKTTLSALLAQLYDCAVFHMDDFFLRPEQRTPERFAQPGGNVDRERFLQEVLLPHRKGQTVTFQKFDCSTMSLMPPVTVESRPLTVIEGAYSMHPTLAEYYDLSAFLDISPDYQRIRIKKRNTPQMAERFFERWIPMEQRYFEAYDIKEKCNLCIPIEP